MGAENTRQLNFDVVYTDLNKNILDTDLWQERKRRRNNELNFKDALKKAFEVVFGDPHQAMLDVFKSFKKDAKPVHQPKNWFGLSSLQGAWLVLVLKKWKS